METGYGKRSTIPTRPARSSILAAYFGFEIAQRMLEYPAAFCPDGLITCERQVYTRESGVCLLVGSYRSKV
jgi:hypothetical protein